MQTKKKEKKIGKQIKKKKKERFADQKQDFFSFACPHIKTFGFSSLGIGPNPDEQMEITSKYKQVKNNMSK